MVRRSSSCPSERLERLLAGRLTKPEVIELDAHLTVCADCREALEGLAADPTWWADLPRLSERDPDDDATSPNVDEDHDLGFLEPSDIPDSLGRLDHYEVEGVLGRGGMGVVLRAFDPTLHRPVAIKVIAPQLATSAAGRRRFAREARAAAAVSHDHVVAIHAVAESPSGLPYLVMPFVPGRSLQDRIDQSGPLGVAEILRIGAQTAAGLAAAHAQGLVHRDIKPANILLENGVERVKITDFGLARVADDANQSHSGFIAGTPQYMAPEQASGEPIDPRADLFSLGSVLYAMATGHSPFRAATNVAVLRRVCEDNARPIREINPEIPAWLAAIIARLHEKDPADRFQSAAEVADLLARCLAYLERPDGSPPPYAAGHDRSRSRRSARRRMTAALAVALAGLVAMAAWSGSLRTWLGTVLRIATPEGTLAVEVDDPQVEVRIDDGDLVITGGGPREIRLAIGTHRLRATKDGKTVAQRLVTITRGRKKSVVIGREAAEYGTVIEVPENYRPGPARPGAPARTRVVAGPEIPGAGPEVLLRPVPLDDHSPVPLWPGQAITYMAYSRDGKLLAMASNLDRKVLLFELPARRLRATLTGHSARVMELAFSPDGTKLAAATGHWGFSAKSGEVWLWDLNRPGGAGSNVVTAIPMVFTVAFSPDGRTLAYGGWDDVISLYDLASAKVRAVCRGHEERIRSVAYSPDGKRLASGGADKTVRLWDPETGEPLGDPFPPLRCEVPTVAFSPDGTLLAAHSIHFASAPPDAAEAAQIQVWEVSSRRELASLRGHPHNVWHMAFSPDGRTLASAGGSTNKSGEVIVWDTSKWAPRATLRGFPAAVECVAFASDGKALAAATTHLGIRSEIRVWDLTPTAAAARRELRANGDPESCRVWSVAFAPGGKTLAVGLGNWGTHGRLWLWEVGSGRGRLAHRARLGVRTLAYTRDGKHMAIGTFDGVLLVCDGEGREQRLLEGTQATINAVAFSPDGALLASASQDGTITLWEVETGSRLRRVRLRPDEAWSLAFSPDGTTLAAGLESGPVVLLDVATGEERLRLRGHELGVGGIAYTPDGATFVSGGWDRTVRLWHAASGACLATLRGHDHPITSVAVSPDGRWAASGEGSATDLRAPASLLVWDLGARSLQARHAGHARRIWSVAFSPDGELLASGSDDGTVKFWDAPGRGESD